MDFKQIRIEKRDCGYWVAVDDMAAICLGRDEALGQIASVLFGQETMFGLTKEEERAYLLNSIKNFGGSEYADTEWAEFLAFLGLPFEPLERED